MAITGASKRKGTTLSLAASVAALLASTMSVLILPAFTAPALAADMNGAVAKYNAKDYQGALNEFKAVFAKEPKNSLARYYMALCNQCLARVEEAKKDYKWVIDNGAPSLKANATTGLNQLEKVGGRTGGTTAAAAPAPTKTATADTAKPGPDLIERNPAAAKDPKEKTAATTPATTKPAAGGKEEGGAVARVINFYSDASRGSQLMEQSWDEVKAKYPKITFQKISTGDPLCEKYNVSEFPTVVMIDKNGKALATQAGPQSTEQMETAINTCNQKK